MALDMEEARVMDLLEFAIERAINYRDNYLPKWAQEHWNEENTDTLARYLLKTLEQALEEGAGGG